MSLKFVIWESVKFEFEPFPKQMLVFRFLQYKSFENTMKKGEIAHNKQFLLFPQYCPFGEFSVISNQI